MLRVEDNDGLAHVTDAKLSWIRRNALLWSDVQPTETGGYNWSAVAALEQEMINASTRGMKLILIVRGIPSWAQQNAGTACGPIRLDKVSKFGDFMHEAVKRYADAPYNVKYWEIWNEPDVDPAVFSPTDRQSAPYGCYGNLADPYFGGGRFGDMLKVVYPRIKAANASAIVISGSLLMDCIPLSPTTGCGSRNPAGNPLPSRFLEGMLRSGAGTAFDILGIHAYDNYRGAVGAYGMGGFNSAWNLRGPVIHAKSDFVRSVLATYGLGSKPIINTESGIGCGDPCDTPNYDLTMAYYVPQAYAATLAERLRGNVMYSTTSTWFSTNLLDPVTLAPRPGFTALAYAQSKFEDARFTQYITAYPNVRIYELTKGNGKRMWIAVSANGANHAITLPSTPAAISNSLGASVTTSQNVTVGLNTLYIEWP